MKNGYKKRLDGSVKASIGTRPIKIAYLVPADDSEQNHKILDAVFYESYTRWAGAYTLIIPSTSSAFVHQSYEDWLVTYDPDFIYSYLDLDYNLVERIDELCCPVASIQHKPPRISPIEKESRWRDFLPELSHYCTPVSSISTVSSPHLRSAFVRTGQTDELTIATQFDSGPNERFFNDNFGEACNPNIVLHPMSGLFKILCLVPPNLPKNVNVDSEECTTLKEMLAAIGKGSAQPVARLAMTHSEEIPKQESSSWSKSFSLIIGKSFLDRVHFWNSRFFCPNYISESQSMIAEKSFFDDPDQVAELGKYLNARNRLGADSGQHWVCLHSFSHSVNELETIRDALQKQTYNRVFISKTVDEPALPQKQKPHYSRRSSNDSYDITILETESVFLAKEPFHFSYLPSRYKNMELGQWAVDISLQRHNDLSKYSNVTDEWELPRRRKITQAFSSNLGKVTRDGALTLLPSNKNQPTFFSRGRQEFSCDLHLPDDETFFRLLVQNTFQYPKDDLRANVSKKPYKCISISDKGQNLRGVISMVGSLSEAYSLLTNFYWRAVLRAAKPESARPEPQAESARPLVFSCQKLEGLLPNGKEFNKLFAEQSALKQEKSVPSYLRAILADTLEQLIRQNIFQQVHDWRCRYCGHINFRSLDTIKVKNICEICSSTYYAPIDLKWKFQLSEFVHRSLVTHNGLVVLWALGCLHDEIGNNFWYLPEVDLFENYDSPASHEIDLLCIKSGRFYAVEAKLSASQLVKDTDETKKFITKINKIEPDVAVLAFEQYCNPAELQSEADIKTKLNELIKSIEPELPKRTTLKVLVAKDTPGFDELPVDFGYRGDRTQAFLEKGKS